MGSNKTDMERVGLFKEMGFHTLGDPYKNTNQNFNEAAGKGRQLQTCSTKSKNATQVGYFQTEFPRIFGGEANTDVISMRRRWRNEANKKIVGKQWVPSNGDKKMSGLGSNFGTIGGKHDYFSAASRGEKKVEEHAKNFLTNPGKKGTGYGFDGVTISPYPEAEKGVYINDVMEEKMKKLNRESKAAMKAGAFRLGMHPRKFFNENPFGSDRPLGPSKSAKEVRFTGTSWKPSNPGKHLAGMKAGGFDKWPEHSKDTYVVTQWQSRPIKVVNNSGKTFMPTSGVKSATHTSVINQNVDKRVNVKNYTDVKCVTAC